MGEIEVVTSSTGAIKWKELVSYFRRCFSNPSSKYELKFSPINTSSNLNEDSVLYRLRRVFKIILIRTEILIYLTSFEQEMG